MPYLLLPSEAMANALGPNMQMNKLIRLAEQPARPIHRRWPRKIGAYRWLDYFVHLYNRAPTDSAPRGITIKFNNTCGAKY